MRRLHAAGAVMLGKLATHEFAIGGPAFDLPWPPARNPWDTRRFTGGSSSGSGAAVAAGLALGALGSDTGGSIRLPAAYCGIAGIKPTPGLVSRRGVIPLAPSLDTAGPMAWTAQDCAILLDALAGHDPADPASVPGRRCPTPRDRRAAAWAAGRTAAPVLRARRAGLARDAADDEPSGGDPAQSRLPGRGCDAAVGAGIQCGRPGDHLVRGLCAARGDDEDAIVRLFAGVPRARAGGRADPGRRLHRRTASAHRPDRQRRRRHSSGSTC